MFPERAHRILRLRSAQARGAEGELDAPFETCAEKRAGKPFSPHETNERRAKEGGTCCYLDRCQISYRY